MEIVLDNKFSNLTIAPIAHIIKNGINSVLKNAYYKLASYISLLKNAFRFAKIAY